MGLRVQKNILEYESIVDNHPKKGMSMYSLIRLLGIFNFVGWGFMFFSIHLDLNHKFEWVRVEGIHVDGKMMGEFFLCLITVGFIFLDCYIYILKKCGEERFY